MELQLVSYEQAKALKEVGFPDDVVVYHRYDDEGNLTTGCVSEASTVKLNLVTGELTVLDTFEYIVAPVLELGAPIEFEQTVRYYWKAGCREPYRDIVIDQNGELNPHISSNNIYLSHKEATLAAIDAALGYLTDNKK